MSNNKEKHPSEYDKRTKIYKDWKKSQDRLKDQNKVDEISLAGTTETFKVEIKGDEDIREARLIMSIRENMPEYLLNEIMQLVKCECVIEAYDKFMTTTFPVSVSMQDKINQAYYEFFGERVRRTACPQCMRRRITKVRNHLKKLIKDV